MPMFATTSDGYRAAGPKWRKICVFIGSQRRCLSEVEGEEGHCLEAMLHWRDPAERQRLLRCRRHALVEDNPTSG
jgi:hypothetical protein